MIAREYFLSRPFLFGVAFSFFLITSHFAQAHSPCDSLGWSSDPAVNLQVSPWGQNPLACSDGQGGAYILWNTNTLFTSQYLQWVDRCGIIRWAAPLEIRGELEGTSYFPALSEDGFGGALIAYTDWLVNGERSHVRVNRVDKNGNLLWGNFGVRASLSERNQFGITAVAPDGQGGAFVSIGIVPDSLYIQYISFAGERLWGDEGIFVSINNLSFDHLLISDEQDGAIVQWFGTETGFKRYDSQGNLLWHLSTPNSSMFYSQMVPDGNGGAVVGGRTPSGGLRSIVANRISPDGDFLWGEGGLIIGDSLGSRSTLTDIHVGIDTVAAIFWTNVRNIFTKDYTAMVQLITPDGQFIFEEGNISISKVSNINFSGSIIESEDSTLLFIWTDLRNMNSDFGDFYAQRLNRFGEPLWDITDILLTDRNFSSRISITDQSGGAIVVWSDEPLHGIFAQQISKNGILGEVLDTITALEPGEKNDLPESFQLIQNYPNPFNSSTLISYRLSFVSDVELEIYSITGQKIHTLFSGRQLPGSYQVSWNGRNHVGKAVSSGIYLYKLTVNAESRVRKMLLTR